MTENLIYEVECELDPDVVADYDAWLPGHVREVLSCAGFLGAAVEAPEAATGERPRRRVRYRLESAAALDRYLENDATRLRRETAERFGEGVRCARRVLRPRLEQVAPAAEPPRCLNCGSVVTGRHCAQCGQAGDVHVLSVREVAGDVTHSLLHLDSRVWRTLRLLVRRPGELTREFIAGRHQMYIPPFRLYLAISILYFALSAVLPDSYLVDRDGPGGAQQTAEQARASEEVRKELEAEGIVTGAAGDSRLSARNCRITIFGEEPNSTDFERALSRACEQMNDDGGKRFFERFAATAPKLMFLFLPLMAAVALLFYWRPRRLYAEHLVLFLHNHAFTFILMGAAGVLGALANPAFPGAGLLEFAAFLLYAWLPYYVYRSMRVVYGNGRILTLVKFFTLSAIYFVLLGITMLGGLIYAMYQIS